MADRPHVWRDADPAGPGGPPLLMLHGTGADEHTLLPLAARVSPGSAVLSVRGTVVENGMNRFFHRRAEGVLDEADLIAQAHALAAFVAETGEDRGIPPGTWVAIGFSNGANMATALTLLHPELVSASVSIAAMRLFGELPPVPDAPRRRLLVVNGRTDELVSEAMHAGLVEQLKEADAEVEVVRHPGGHEIPDAAVPRIACFASSG